MQTNVIYYKGQIYKRTGEIRTGYQRKKEKGRLATGTEAEKNIDWISKVSRKTRRKVRFVEK
jgi:hypothetical protein